MRWLGLLFIGAWCWCASGCFLLRAILWPAETAQALIGQVTHNVAEGLVGGTQQVTTAADSIQNIERILEEYPDAANRDSLERLRDELQEDSGSNPGSRSKKAADEVDSLEDGEVILAEHLDAPLVDDEHDRHRGNFPVKRLDGRLNHQRPRRQISSNLMIEHPSRPQYTQRPQQTEMTVDPRRSNIPKRTADMPLIQVDSDGQLRHNLQVGRGRFRQGQKNNK